ncbi:Spy/CpxP family protein refolding chaperone [Pelobacter seleniigenes]|uniref:Spy/CpxP family protein refolding chaperone n=1 Tax=Pelobacter seleniigenes TaxID=407188 RepID=UPI0004A6DADD|nr:Spy/CpxP family protein refolding chaperone [Pelobacter seleniigenes]
MKKTNVRYLIAVTIVVSSLLLTGCHRHRAPDPDRIAKKLEKHVEHVLSSIDATADQKDKIHAIVSEIQKDAKSMYRNNSFHHNKTLDSLFSDQPDAARLHSQIDEKSEQMTAFFHRTIDHMLEINAVLSPEQRKELKRKYHKAHDNLE